MWQKQKMPSNKKSLNAITKEVKHLIQNHSNEDFNNYISGLLPGDGTNYSLWKATKRLKRPIAPSPVIKKTDGS